MLAGQQKPFVIQNASNEMMIHTLTNNMFRMDICDDICKVNEYTLMIVPRLVIFTCEHRTLEVGSRGGGGVGSGVWIIYFINVGTYI